MNSQRSSNRIYINPIIAIAFLAWSLYMIYVGRLIEVLIPAAILIYLYRIWKRILVLMLWLIIPTIIILSVLFGFTESLEASFRVMLIALSATAALAGPDPRSTAYVASRLGIPPIIGFTQLYVLRLMSLLGHAFREALYTAVCRGVRSRLRQVMLLPIPLLVHTILMSTYLAEALYIKYPERSRVWCTKAVIGVHDIILVIYMALMTVSPVVITHLLW